MRNTLELVRSVPRHGPGHADRAVGLLQPDLCLPARAFLDDAEAAGADGLIVVDLPPEADDELCLPAIARGLNFIRLATPTTDDKRLPAVLANTSGFVYYVSITGITGTAAPDVELFIRTLHASRSRPSFPSRWALASKHRDRPKPSPPAPTAWWWARRWLMRSRKAWVRRANRLEKQSHVLDLVKSLSQALRPA